MIHNISKATGYDVIILRDDVSIYSVDLFKEIVTLNTISVGKRNAIISGYDFFHIICFTFWELIVYHLWPLSVHTL